MSSSGFGEGVGSSWSSSSCGKHGMIANGIGYVKLLGELVYGEDSFRRVIPCFCGLPGLAMSDADARRDAPFPTSIEA